MIKDMDITIPEELLQISNEILESDEEREEFTSKAIEKLKPDVHICGLLHAFREMPATLREIGFSSEKSLVNRIAHLNPEVLKLIDADEF